MIKNIMKNFWSKVCFIAILAVIDQFVKIFLIQHLKTQLGYTIELTPFMNIVYVWNYGISFGLFGNYYQYSNLILLVVNITITLVLFLMLLKTNDYLHNFGIGLIVGGATGNIIDRIIHGAVFDFVHLHYHNLHYPAFNIADMFVTTGVGILIIAYLKQFPLFSKKNNPAVSLKN